MNKINLKIEKDLVIRDGIEVEIKKIMFTDILTFMEEDFLFLARAPQEALLIGTTYEYIINLN
jgi:hypothetical protein